MVRGALCLVLLAVLLNTVSGVTYTRWGRQSCPASATLVYKGYAAGNNYNTNGGGSNYLCLPDNPQYGNVVSGSQPASGYLYGAEYQLENEYDTNNNPFSFENNAGVSLHDYDVSCAVCDQPERTRMLMIPARTDCSIDGWHTEYTGYLMSEYAGHPRSEFVCVDAAPEAVAGSHGDLNGALFYPVQFVCGSLPCPPYVDRHEAACAVCTL